MKLFYVGIDFSKDTFDVCCSAGVSERDVCNFNKFANSVAGMTEMLKWLKPITKCSGDKFIKSVVFCGEHTGSYSIEITEKLAKMGYNIWLADGMDIKYATSSRRRSKTDKSDAYMISQYLCRHLDKAVFYKPLSENEKNVKALFNRHIELVKNKTVWTNRKAAKSIMAKSIGIYKSLTKSDQELVSLLQKQIESNDKLLIKIIRQDEALDRMFQILISFPGIGPITATAIMVYTDFGRRFGNNFRAFAAYCGVCPMQNTSGSSIAKPDRVGSFCNKKMKSLLSMASLTAMHHNPQIADYAHRLLSRGKHFGVVKNNVSYKIIKILFKMLSSGNLYDPNYESQHDDNKLNKNSESEMADTTSEITVSTSCCCTEIQKLAVASNIQTDPENDLYNLYDLNFHSDGLKMTYQERSPLTSEDRTVALA